MAPPTVPLTWRNVSAPDGSGALNAFNRAGENLGNAFEGLGGHIKQGASDYADRETQDFIADLNAAPDDATRNQMVADASQAFLKMDQVNAAVTDAQNQDFRVNQEGRAATRANEETQLFNQTFSQKEKTNPLDIRNLTAETETSERTNKIGKKFDESNARLTHDIKKAAEKVATATTQAKINSAKLTLSNLQEVARNRGVMNPLTEAAAKRTDADAKKVLANDGIAQPLLESLSDPNKSVADRNKALSKLEALQSTSKLSPEMTVRIARATKASLESQTGAVQYGFTSARNALGNVLPTPVLSAHQNGNIAKAILGAPKNIRGLLESQIIKTLESKPENAGLTQIQIKTLAKQQLAADPEVASFVSQVEKRDTIKTSLDDEAVKANLSATAVELGFASDLRTGSYNGLATSIVQKFEGLGGANVDLQKAQTVVQTIHNRAKSLLSKAGISGTAIDVAAVKILNNTLPDRDLLINDMHLPNYGNKYIDGDITDLDDNELLKALADQLPEALQRKLLANKAIQAILNP
jgi:hypothetical protein